MVRQYDTCGGSLYQSLYTPIIWTHFTAQYDLNLITFYSWDNAMNILELSKSNLFWLGACTWLPCWVRRTHLGIFTLLLKGLSRFTCNMWGVYNSHIEHDTTIILCWQLFVLLYLCCNCVGNTPSFAWLPRKLILFIEILLILIIVSVLTNNFNRCSLLVC